MNNVFFVHSNLSRAVFAGADLSEVDFNGAYTYRTRFEDTDLTGAWHLTQAQIDLACGNRNTRLPEGLTASASWPCED